MEDIRDADDSHEEIDSQRQVSELLIEQIEEQKETYKHFSKVTEQFQEEVTSVRNEFISLKANIEPFSILTEMGADHVIKFDEVSPILQKLMNSIANYIF